jgi:IS5 family transposase
MTKLLKPVSRQTNKRVNGRPVVLTIAPCGSQDEALIGVRLLGTRRQYVVRLSDVYRVAALWHGQKESSARRDARKCGVSWARARKAFYQQNSIPT